jgi:hypothetical protein
LDEKGLYGKPGREDAVRWNKTLNVRRLQQKPRTRKTDNKQKDREKIMIVILCNNI